MRLTVVFRALLALSAAFALGVGVLALVNAFVSPDPLVGRASIIDGDTIEIAGKRIRLSGIDAPEIGQQCRDAGGASYRCGRAAADTLNVLVGGQTVTCIPDPVDAEDRYGRVVAFCSVEGDDLGTAMIAAGHAVAARDYLARRPLAAGYVAAEEEARRAKRGLWAGSFETPADWRRERRSGAPAH